MNTFIKRASFALAVGLAVPSAAFAQTSTPIVATSIEASTLERIVADEVVAPPADAAAVSTGNSDSGFGRALAGDFRRFFARDNSKIGVFFASAAIAAARVDRSAANEFRQSPSWVRGGNPGGAIWTEAGGALVTMAIGAALRQPRTFELGSELMRSQIVSQAFVQTLKISADRLRPDASNQLSFPSGHTASAFATATVLDRRFGWKVGAPAYALASYVAASRMASNKHYLSDVIAGAAIGVAAGRAVTMSVGRTQFDLGVVPTSGGAAVTFTRKN